MINNYEVAEIVEIGRAQDVILGTTKVLQIFDDSPHQELRDEAADDE